MELSAGKEGENKKLELELQPHGWLVALEILVG